MSKPADTCVKVRVNEPNHGSARSQNINTLPYQILQTSEIYAPGSVIQITINSNDVFRGFFIQARDKATNKWIGEWQQSSNTKTIPECSGITHSDPRDKTQAVLIWHAPQDKQGQVYFTGTIVKNYGTFWGNIISEVAGTTSYNHLH